MRNTSGVAFEFGYLWPAFFEGMSNPTLPYSGTEQTLVSEPVRKRPADWVTFTKLRLASLVVLSAALCYLFGAEHINGLTLSMMVLGGFLVTASSNGFNQIMERDLDKLMARTCDRPLPSGRMSLRQAYTISIVTGLVGLVFLTVWVSPICGALGAFALISYTLVYTPLKRKTPFAVFVGAFPGAVPPLLGWVAATGRFDVGAWLVFGLQFMWQFPHFWAIAWVLHDDYLKAGFKMLPSSKGRGKESAFQIMVYTLSLLPMVLLPNFFHLTGLVATILSVVLSLLFSWQAIRVYRACTVASAGQLMFGSFAYLPLVQLIMYIDKQ
jgi:protoheme IX farnesyltransferase